MTTTILNKAGKYRLATKNDPLPLLQSPWNWGTMAVVEKVAIDLCETTGKKWLPVDAGDCCSPRYDVVQIPSVGDPVSYGFNGDYYPDGYVKSVSANGSLVITTTGNRYYRRKLTASWKKAGGTWSLVAGHHSELNPSF